MDFVTFVLLNSVLYIRPMDFFPGIQGIYYGAFCVCFFFSLPALIEAGSIRTIFGHPVSVCVTGVVLTSILSNVLQGQVMEASETIDVGIQIQLYYILVVCLVRTPARMKWLLGSLVVDACILAGLGVADYKGIVHVPNLAVVTELSVVDGEEIPLRRLAGTASGVFGDPNDFSLFIVGCIIYSVYFIGDRTAGLPRRVLWLLPLPLLFQAMILTYSRGGALSLMCGMGVFALLRYRWRALPLALLALPIVFRGGGRQSDFDVSAGSGQARVRIWESYMGMFFSNPLLGVGAGRWSDYAHQVAHNSYIQTFAERGFVGGMAFLSMVLLSIWSVARTKPTGDLLASDELLRLRSYLLASIISFAIGIMTLSRVDVLPTYTLFGLAVAYERMAAGDSPRGTLRFGPRLMCLLVVASVMFLAAVFIFIKRNASYY